MATSESEGTEVIATRQLLRVDAICPHCRDWIVATADPEGIWIECACDVGYAGAKIRVLLT